MTAAAVIVVAPLGARTAPPWQRVAESPHERRCRDLVVEAQLGDTPSDAETQFMRGGRRVD